MQQVPRFSVVIPAYDEASVIGRCLEGITAGAGPDEFELIVICNGCSDATAEIARSFGPLVRVVETKVASKSRALNLGDSIATEFPRIYLDADINVELDVLRALSLLLADGSPVLAASPQGVVQYEDRGPLVRSFYKVWTSLPYFKDGPFGAGLFAFSREGRKRFGRFPEIISDDGFARLSVMTHERQVLRPGTFSIFPPKTLRGVLDINVRARAGLYEVRSKYPQLVQHEPTSAMRSIREVVQSPSLWIHAVVYFGVMLTAMILARHKLWMGQEGVWERDLTSREPTLDD